MTDVLASSEYAQRLELDEQWDRTPVVRKRRRGWLVRRVLVTADILGLLLAFASAEFTRSGAGVVSSTSAEVVQASARSRASSRSR